MKINAITRSYGQGWMSLIHTLYSVFVWEVVICIPAFPFFLFLPDHMEGKADGAIYAQLACLVCLLVWVPFVSAKMGPLDFVKKVKGVTDQSEDTFDKK